MAGGGKGAGKGGKGGSSGATNADLQDDEDMFNNLWKSNHFRDWAKKYREKRTIGTPIVYDKSPAPPKK
jgi:hypothetical protein